MRGRWIGKHSTVWRFATLAAIVLFSGGAAQGARDAAPANTAPPTVSGTAREGETLSASSGSWSGSSPITFSFRWQRCSSSGGSCANISGATAQTYKLVSADAGRTIRVSVTATNGDGSANALSSPTSVVGQGQQPVNTSPPTITGTAKDGQTLTAHTGAWTNNPTSFSYQWLRCNASGSACREVGNNARTYRLDQRDVGSTMRVEVRAGNAFGSNPGVSGRTAMVAPRGPLPASASPPTISGTPKEGQTLVARAGSWTNAPTRFAYRWSRCDTAGNNCATIGAGSTQRLGPSDVGRTIRLTVWATNRYGTGGPATSVPTAVIASALPSGAIKLPSGEISLPVQQVALPHLLVISGVVFAPNRLSSRNAFVGRFRVTDTRGYVIRDAIVYAIGLPYAWIRAAPEAVTSTDGWAQITFIPTTFMPLRRASIVFFVRARKPGDSLLSGVSARRLVQVRVG
jgi:hypothetical protein